ncbi:11356_t:CDS:2 [Diversispora eburnea]|uniref:11356_t:CDS:1 n=1 Tax=Diversispora eburnea TaxID=1213867 RepID=A0A9N9BZ65_9GLOM|nr:11356_t:CDS:2 [Diversispora eburnea]
MNSGFNYDSIVTCGNKPNVVDFEVHSAILGARSSYFRLASSLNYPLRKSGMFLFDLKDIEPNIFELLLKYFYTSNIELNSISHEELFKLLIACDELILPSIIDNIQICLINNHSEHFESDPFSYLIKLYTCKRCSTLKTWLIQQLLQNPKSLIFNSPNFNSASKELLVELFQRRYEDVDEIEIWWKLLEWSVHQANFSVYYSPSPFDYDILELNLDEFESWDEKDCERVKQILSEIIILIRWKEISFENFIVHISPHQKLFPPSLYENILSYYKIETKFQPFESSSNVENVENDNNNEILKNEFGIILKDGTIIYNKKNNIFDTNLSDIEPTTSSKLQRHIWMDTKDAFLFSFQHLLPNTGVLSRVVKSSSHKAICYDPLSGPGFGAGLDIVVSNRYKMISTWGHYSYPEAQYFLAEQHSEIEDYEVFQVERDENIPIDDNDEEEKVSYEEKDETKDEAKEETKETEKETKETEKEIKKETKKERRIPTLINRGFGLFFATCCNVEICL